TGARVQSLPGIPLGQADARRTGSWLPAGEVGAPTVHRLRRVAVPTCERLRRDAVRRNATGGLLTTGRASGRRAAPRGTETAGMTAADRLLGVTPLGRRPSIATS